MNDRWRTRFDRWRLPAPSVRVRLIALITLVSSFALLAVGIAAYSVERQRILADVEERLDAHLAAARFLVAEDPPPEGWETSRNALRAIVQRMSADDNTGAVGIENGAATLVPGVPLDVDLAASREFIARVVAETTAGQPVIGTFTGGGVVWRYLAAPVQVEGSSGDAVFAMAYDLEAVLAELDDAAGVYLVAAAIAVVVIAGVAWLGATRLLRPLRDMRQTAERVSAQSLSERLPVHGSDDVSELAHTMNALLDRLHAALASQRRLLSDIGHELKTPITIVQGQLEVADVDDPDDVRETHALVIDELDRMNRLVQDLAGTASLYGPVPISPRPTDIADLVHQIARKAESIPGAEVSVDTIAETVARVDGERITQAMLQLAQNAATHGGGRIELGSRIDDGALVLWVRDHGAGVPDEVKTLIFERFQRGPDRGRRREEGSGLGLDIVQVIARAHGGEARVEDAQGGGAVFILTIPLHAAVSRPEQERLTWHPY